MPTRELVLSGLAPHLSMQIGLGRVVAMGSIFTAAALWRFAPAKRRALRRCSRTVPFADRGWRAERDRAHFGAISAASCVITCWGFMAALAAVGHGFVAMSALFVIQLHERIAPRYVRSQALRSSVHWVYGPSRWD